MPVNLISYVMVFQLPKMIISFLKTAHLFCLNIWYGSIVKKGFMRVEFCLDFTTSKHFEIGVVPRLKFVGF